MRSTEKARLGRRLQGISLGSAQRQLRAPAVVSILELLIAHTTSCLTPACPWLSSSSLICFGDFSPKKGSALAAAVSSPRALNALGPALQRLEALHSQDAATQPQLAHKTGLKVTLKQHRLAVSDAAKAAGSEAAAAKVVSQEGTSHSVNSCRAASHACCQALTFFSTG